MAVSRGSSQEACVRHFEKGTQPRLPLTDPSLEVRIHVDAGALSIQMALDFEGKNVCLLSHLRVGTLRRIQNTFFRTTQPWPGD